MSPTQVNSDNNLSIQNVGLWTPYWRDRARLSGVTPLRRFGSRPSAFRNPHFALGEVTQLRKPGPGRDEIWR
jgi:hypothetical protein